MDAVTTSALIGAGSALAGVFLSQLLSMFQASAERKSRHRELMRNKLEELAHHLIQTDRWLDVWFHQISLSRTGLPEPSQSLPGSSDEARRAYVLSLLYFPDLRAEAQRVMKSLNTLHYENTAPNVNEDALLQASKDFLNAQKSLKNLIALEAEKLT